MDVDKWDYLARDAHYLGLEYDNSTSYFENNHILSNNVAVNSYFSKFQKYAIEFIHRRR